MNKIFLFINTAAHIPTIFSVAKLLKKSGRYRPVILFARADIYLVALEKADLLDCDLYVYDSDGFVGLEKHGAGESSAPGGDTPTWSQRLRLLIRQWALSCLLSLYKDLTYCFSITDYISMCLRLDRFGCIKYIFRGSFCPDVAQSGAVREILQSIFHRKMIKDYGNFSEKNFLKFRDGMFYGIYELRKYNFHVSSLIDALKPVLVVLPEENLLYNHCYVVKVARDKNIRCCVVPFTVANQREWLEAFFDVPEFQVSFGWNKLFMMAYPNWSASYKGRQMILPGLHVFTSEYLGCAPKVPWLINSGTADVIAVESGFMMSFYKKSGIEESRMKLTGSTSDDRLYEVLKNRRAQRQNIKNRLSISGLNGSIFLIALPPDQFSASAVNKTEFQNHQELIDYMLSVVMSERRRGDIVVVNLHPRTSIDKISLPSCDGLYVTNDAIENLVPVSDLFIAVSSATIRLAVSCGIHVINYNAYGYDYDEYREIESVVEVNSRDEYGAAVRKYIGGFSEFGRAPRENDGLLDGLSDKRLLDLFDELAV